MNNPSTVVITSFSDIVEENGKTIRENNLSKKHNIPLGSVVTIRFNNTYGACLGTPDEIDLGFSGKATVVVVEHTRDCDGTPLYNLSTNAILPPANISDMPFYKYWTGFFFTGYHERDIHLTGKVIPVRMYSEMVRSLYGK